MERRFLIFLGAVLVYLPLLLTDSPGLLPQLALGAATAAFLWLFARRGAIVPRQIITAIIVATIGECVLSLGWGLYTYRNALIPLYVPFGHGIFYALAAESARQNALRRIAPAITRGVLGAGSIIANREPRLFPRPVGSSLVGHRGNAGDAFTQPASAGRRVSSTPSFWNGSAPRSATGGGGRRCRSSDSRRRIRRAAWGFFTSCST